MPTNSGNFDSVWSVFNRNAVYVIPTFQRPYAWEEKQLSDLYKDIEIACTRPNPYHYLSPIHLVKINHPKDSIWQNYTDNNNDDIKTLTTSQFTDDDGGRFEVYLVVDGQQRLTTLFILLAFAITGKLGKFATISCQNKDIPKIVLNPLDDHEHFRNLLGLPFSTPTVKLRSQDRLDYLFNYFTKKVVLSQTHNIFIKGNDHVLLLIELNPNHGLQTFLTLNDRGKDLTTFEKMKSLFMEYDINFCSPPKPVDIHKVFGTAYKVSDRHNCIVNENQLIQLSSINLWVTRDSDVPSKGAEVLYEQHFRGANSSTICKDLHQNWLPIFTDVMSRIDYLTDFLDGSHSSCPSHSNIHAIRTVKDDYEIIIKSLVLSLRSLAVLFKFRQIFNCEWHDKIGTINLNNHSIKNLLITELGRITMEIKALEDNQKLMAESNSLNAQIMKIKDETRDISVLELVEMMELIVFKMGSTKPANYSATWNNAFGQTNIAIAITQWFNYIVSFGSRDKFFNYLLTESPDIKDLHFRYILREYESFESDRNLHFEHMDIEHAFPRDPSAISHTFSSYGFNNEFEYKIFCEIIGNKIWLDSELNSSVKNFLLSVKSGAYQSQKFGSVTVPLHRQAKSAIILGGKLSGVTNDSHYKYYMLLRRLEIILFTLKRF